MDHTSKESMAVVNTLKTARGHIDGILKMIEEDRYCIDVAKQLLAVNALVRKANNTVLRQHMNTCLVEGIRSGHAQEKIDEVLGLINSYMLKD